MGLTQGFMRRRGQNGPIQPPIGSSIENGSTGYLRAGSGRRPCGTNGAGRSKRIPVPDALENYVKLRVKGPDGDVETP
jgi:hypothetical protein